MDNNEVVRTWYVVVEDPANDGLPAILDQVTGGRVDSASTFVSSLAKRGLRRATITVYMHAICGFLQFCSSNPREKGRRGTTPGLQLKRYIVGLALEEERDRARRDLPARSPSRERTRLRTLFNTLVRYLEFCVLQEAARLTREIPSWHEVQQAFADARARRGAGLGRSNASVARSVSSADKVISESELRSLVTLTDERAGLAMMIFYYLGLDARWAVGLRYRDVHVDRGMVTVEARLANKSREIEAFVLPASTALFSRLLSRMQTGRGRESLLFSPRDLATSDSLLSAEALQRLIAQESGRVGRSLTVRQLQVWGAAEALRKGESMDMVLRRLGHKTWRSELRKAVDVLSSPILFPRMSWMASQESELDQR